MFAILFEGLLIEIQEEIHQIAVLGGGGFRGTKIVNKYFVNKLAFPINWIRGTQRATREACACRCGNTQEALCASCERLGAVCDGCLPPL